MKVADYLMASCWCSRTEVEIPVAWVSQGLTGSCDYPGCGPGCAMVPNDDTDPDPYDEQYEPRKWKMNKFDPSRYDPRDDSTEGLPRRPEEVSLLVGEGVCACGCGKAPSGPKAKFCMGHDARLKGALTRAYSAGCDIALVEESTGTATVLGPLEYADQFSTDKVDWRQLIEDAAAKIAERRVPANKRNSEKEVLARASRDGAVKVGRWEKTDSVAAIYRMPDGKFQVEYVDGDGRIAQKVVDVA